jgi:dienelactone hydrolase
LNAIAAFYNRDELMRPGSALFPKPPAIAPEIKRVRTLKASAKDTAGEVLDLSWPSAFTPLWTRAAAGDLRLDRSGELIDKYMRAQRNQTAHARWFRHASGPRPCVVLLHGYMAGTYAIEERIWPAQKLFESGLDVVISVLPFHGPRRSEARGYRPPAFPSSDPRFTIEGMRQLVNDHEALFDYLLDGHEGTRRVASLGVMGMSLGGYGAALLCTLDPRLQFGVFVIPLAAIEDFAHTHGRFVGTEAEQHAQRLAMSRAQAPVSPLSRPPLIEPERAIVLAGESDWVTGMSHARRLSAHFATETRTFEGGHLLQFGLGRAFAPVWKMLEQAGHLASG